MKNYLIKYFLFLFLLFYFTETFPLVTFFNTPLTSLKAKGDKAKGDKAKKPKAKKISIETSFETQTNIDFNSYISDGSLDSYSNGPNNGTINSSQIDNNILIYTPNGNFSGEDSFDYTIVGDGGSDENEVTITVNPPPAPTAPAINGGTTNYMTEKSITVIPPASSDADITVTAASSNSGETSFNDTSITFTPNSGVTGDVNITYTVSDQQGGSSSGTISVTVNPTPPTAPDIDGGSTSYMTEKSITVIPPAAGTNISIQSASSDSGTATVSGNDIEFTPSSSIAGDVSISYNVVDEVGQTTSGTISLTVNPPPAPVATTDTVTVESYAPTVINVLENDTGTDKSIRSVQNPTDEGGSAVISENNIVYTSAEGFSGPDSFTYTITDIVGQTSESSVSVTVYIAPSAENDTTSTNLNTPVTVNVLSNDSGTGISIKNVQNPTDEGGSAIISDNDIVYTPAAGFSGTDTFTYTIQSEYGDESTATVTVEVKLGAISSGNINSFANESFIDGTAIADLSSSDYTCNEIIFKPATFHNITVNGVVYAIEKKHCLHCYGSG